MRARGKAQTLGASPDDAAPDEAEGRRGNEPDSRPAIDHDGDVHRELVAPRQVLARAVQRVDEHEAGCARGKPFAPGSLLRYDRNAGEQPCQACHDDRVGRFIGDTHGRQVRLGPPRRRGLIDRNHGGSRLRDDIGKLFEGGSLVERGEITTVTHVGGVPGRSCLLCRVLEAGSLRSVNGHDAEGKIAA